MEFFQNLGPWQTALLVAGALVAASLLLLVLAPAMGLRFLLFLITKALYRIRVDGLEHVPRTGGGLLVCNHQSFVDGLLVMAALNRPARPIMFDEMYQRWWIRPIANVSKAIPISDRMGPREMLKSLHSASEAITGGDLVVIFAEGQISRTGQLLAFRKGLERIMKGVEAPIIPMNLDRVRGSWFSFDRNRRMRWLPARLAQPITVTFGAPLPGSTTTAEEVRKHVQRLHTEAWAHRKESTRLLHREAFATGRRRPLEKGLADATNLDGVTRAKFLTSIVALARMLRPEWEGQKMVGICLPPSIAGAAVNHAALLMGKVAVNLNYTASPEILANIAKQCELTTVVASRAFQEKLPLQLPGRVICLEDVAKGITGGMRVVSLLQGLFMPLSWLERSLGSPSGRSVDDLATIIFSSGSTGDPKGVMLSHWNIASNIDSAGEVFHLGPGDAILGILPFFHSFGTMATLFLPHALGIRAVYYPNPLDAQAIGALVEHQAVTFMVATPTFLSSFTRRVPPPQFGSLTIVMTGAEKLKESVATAFERRFGIRPQEGFGCTECAPVVSVNTQDYRARGFYQCGAKPGKIGQPIPGVSIKIVDINTFEEVADGQEGLLLVNGPNVMMGYLGRPDLTKEAMRDGWYVTGDIAKVDEDGFAQITDRLSRFSKIGGEMVPHGRVEEALNKALDLAEVGFAVTGIPDEKKGEKLAVLYCVKEEQAREASEKIARSGELPNLYLPKWKDFHRAEKIPMLGTGKMDLRAIKAFVLERDAAKPQAGAEPKEE